MKQMILEVFTDPMMGLSYEHEPVLEQLRKHYGKQLKIRYIMPGLVRDIADFMTGEELSLPEEEGIRRYNMRLADIYRSEEEIGGLPMRMDGLRLFDRTHRSSYPVCIAYEAVKLTDPEKADMYLYHMRQALMIGTKQITDHAVLLETVAAAGADPFHAFISGICIRYDTADIRKRKKTVIRSFQSDITVFSVILL